ncbi:methionyl-tRNA formyltransferase [Bifidobacterium leontopitheci]|uniref:Methionyl-tRNA formyltransferase n=1 Tax=Bifidobacterium leontopitheci TaxID=2650774 RepID=A0A6I1GIH7_9BIFI|nr:methionyl-tRNA formyltransferase [Bifidobacterium leontopitheci]KAB7791395.1 methionyl-tRNA formyltransferase [Bifidobacterium leontopitheci]
MLKILFAGTPDVAVPSLRALVADSEHVEVVAVLTRPDAPTGRGRRLTPSPVKQAALELGLPVLESDPGEPAFLDELAATGAQAAAVIAYGRILKQSVLDALPFGWYNLHFSLLPYWRGAAPVQRAIWAGDATTGVSVFRITRAMDAGPILQQSETPIGEHETAGDLLARLGESGAFVLRDALRTVEDGSDAPVEQEPGTYPVADKIRVEDAHIDFTADAAAVDRQIRACTPNPGAWGRLHPDGENGSEDALVLHVLRAQPADPANPNTPQELASGSIKAGKRNVWVGTGSTPLELLEVKAQGKKAMRAADWARGARLTPDALCR